MTCNQILGKWVLDSEEGYFSLFNKIGIQSSKEEFTVEYQDAGVDTFWEVVTSKDFSERTRFTLEESVANVGVASDGSNSGHKYTWISEDNTLRAEKWVEPKGGERKERVIESIFEDDAKKMRRVLKVDGMLATAFLKKA